MLIIHILFLYREFGRRAPFVEPGRLSWNLSGLLAGSEAAAAADDDDDDDNDDGEALRRQYFEAAKTILALPSPSQFSQPSNPSLVFAAGLRAAAECLVAGEALLGSVVVGGGAEEQEEGDA